MTATTAIQPRPAVMFSENRATLPQASWAPAEPAQHTGHEHRPVLVPTGLTPSVRRRVRRLADPAQPEPPHMPATANSATPTAAHARYASGVKPPASREPGE